MTTEINPFLTNTPFLNENNVNFLQIKQGAIRQKDEKNVHVITYVHMRRDTPLLLCVPEHIFADPLHSSSCVST